jgi:hypothetical protein
MRGGSHLRMTDQEAIHSNQGWRCFSARDSWREEVLRAKSFNPKHSSLNYLLETAIIDASDQQAWHTA